MLGGSLLSSQTFIRLLIARSAMHPNLAAQLSCWRRGRSCYRGGGSCCRRAGKHQVFFGTICFVNSQSKSSFDENLFRESYNSLLTANASGEGVDSQEIEAGPGGSQGTQPDQNQWEASSCQV